MRARLRYAKFGKVRFVSHRDMARVWERVLRRAELPIAYTEGFSPRPKLHFGLALSTGFESYGEYLDVDFRGAADEEGAVVVDLLPECLTQLLPEGVEVEAVQVLEGKTMSLQQAVTSCTWKIQVGATEAVGVQDRIDSVMQATELPVTRTRKGKPVHDDIRPLVHQIDVREDESEEAGNTAVLIAELGTQPRALRPGELVELIDSELELVKATRLFQWTTSDGAKREPLPLDATRTAPEVMGAT